MTQYTPPTPWESQLPQETPTRVPLWKRPLVILAATAVAMAVAFAIAFAVSGTKELTIEFTLFDARGVPCDSGGRGGYSDIGPGNSFTVRDENNKVIGNTNLPLRGEDTGVSCTWTMYVQVPDDADQYVIEGNRGDVVFSREELERHDWVAEITLGM